jgi:hypothetical protein
VNKDNANPDWYSPEEISARMSAFAGSAREVLKAAREVFGEDNVRFYGGGIPEVFLDGGLATDAKLERLLVWS